MADVIPIQLVKFLPINRLVDEMLIDFNEVKVSKVDYYQLDGCQDGQLKYRIIADDRGIVVRTEAING